MNCSEIFSVGPNFTPVKLDVTNYTDSSCRPCYSSSRVQNINNSPHTSSKAHGQHGNGYKLLHGQQQSAGERANLPYPSQNNQLANKREINVIRQYCVINRSSLAELFQSQFNKRSTVCSVVLLISSPRVDKDKYTGHRPGKVDRSLCYSVHQM